jgi:hypothetical protein
MVSEALLDRLVKLMGHQKSAEAIGSMAEAQAFAGKLHSLLLKHEIELSDLEAAAARDRDPMGETAVRGSYRRRVRRREALARVIARAHFCRTLVASGSGTIWFVGRDSHRALAVYLFETVEAWAEAQFRRDHRAHVEMQGAARGYKTSWFGGLQHGLFLRFSEVRKAAESDARRLTGGTALVLRLAENDAAVARYIEETVKGRARSLRGAKDSHYAAREAGFRAAREAPITPPIAAGKATRGHLTARSR